MLIPIKEPPMQSRQQNFVRDLAPAQPNTFLSTKKKRQNEGSTCDGVHATVETAIDDADGIDDQAKDGQFTGIWAPGSRIGGQQVAVQEQGDRDGVGGMTRREAVLETR